MKRNKDIHVGIIPDGMRRWSRENNVSLTDSYLTSLKNIENTISYFFDKGVKILSAYGLSSDNLQRNDDEIEPIIYAETLYLKKFLPQICQKWDAKFIAVGDIDNIKNLEFKESILNAQELTKNNIERKLYVLINYNPLFDIISMSKNINNSVVDYFDFFQVKEPVDLLIRTGKVKRTSNFLPFHIGYAELRFIDKLFIDVQVEDFKYVYEEFTKDILNAENRKYGK
jgi:undecaprenyl diphosphate synthase